MRQRPFPFHSLGYTRNPFGALSDQEWVAAAVLPDAIIGVLEGSANIQLLGPKGAGKSTILRKATAVLQAAGQVAAYEYIPEGQRQFTTPLATLNVFCLDEAQRLGLQEKRRLLRWSHGKGRLIVGTHRKVGTVWPDRSLFTIYLPDLITADLWQAALTQRLAVFAIPDRPRLTFAPDSFEYLHQVFGADMREGEYFLYEVWQQQKAVTAVTASDLETMWQTYQKRVLPGGFG